MSLFEAAGMDEAAFMSCVGDKKAIEAYQAILKDHGDELPAYKALDRIYQQTGKWPELASATQKSSSIPRTT